MLTCKLLGILILSLCFCFTKVQAEQVPDSSKVAIIDKEAANPDFIHAYLLIVDAGKAFYSVSGHAAIRMVCADEKSKGGIHTCSVWEISRCIQAGGKGSESL